MHLGSVLLIIFLSILHAHAIIVESNVQQQRQTNSESTEAPKAEALIQVIKLKKPHKIHPLRIIKHRQDDVVVIHNNRPRKRKPSSSSSSLSSSSKRRPSSQYRSKIKYPSGNTLSGGFKDFTHNDYSRYSSNPFFPSKSPYAEPPIKARNKYKHGPPPSISSSSSNSHDISYNYNSQSNFNRPPHQSPPTQYGPPSSLPQSPSHQPISPQYNLPASIPNELFNTYTIDAVNPSKSSSYIYEKDVLNKVPTPINNFPLESNTADPYKSPPKTSYGVPVNNNNIQQHQQPQRQQPQQQQPQQQQIYTSPPKIHSMLVTPRAPSLPNRYEQSEFSNPSKVNPLADQFPSSFGQYFNEASESQKVHTTVNKIPKFNKFNNFDYDFGSAKGGGGSAGIDDYSSENDNYDYSFHRTTSTTTTSTTQRPRTTKRPRRRRPENVQVTHNLDTDDLRDAFVESSDFHEVALGENDFINFDSQRQNYNQRKKNHQSTRNSPFSAKSQDEIQSTLKQARNKNPHLKNILGDDFQIVSIEKSIEKDANQNFGFQRKSDVHKPLQTFKVNSQMSFGGLAPVLWNGDFAHLPRNHKLIK